NSWGIEVNYSGKKLSNEASIVGVDKDFLSIVAMHLADGHNMNAFMVDNKSAVCIIGHDIAKELFDQTSPIGEMIHIEQKKSVYPWRIIGVLGSKRSNKNDTNYNMLIITPYTFFESVVQHRWQKSIFEILLELKSGSDVPRVGEAIQRYFEA